MKKAKKEFYKNKIKQLKQTNPKKWHQQLKKMMRIDQTHSEEIIVEEIKDLPDKKQAELIADKFAEVSSEYEKLKTEDIKIPWFSESEIPQVEENDIAAVLACMDGSKSSILGDIPSKFWKIFAKELSKPVTNVINTAMKQGIWPDILKHEIVTPVPKKFPPKSRDELRNISGLLNLDKIFEKIVSKMIIQDMKHEIDPSQYANQQGLSMEIIHLLSAGLASYNLRHHVPSNIELHNQILDSSKLKTKQHLELINDWTKKKKMKLNIKKTKNMIFNFSRKYKFTTNMTLENENIETETETKLLGTYLTSDLKWNKNTSEIVKQSFKRMQILNRAAQFTTNRNDLRNIYISYIRSILEKSAVVWHSSLTAKNRKDLERIQKCAVSVIMGKNYTTYREGLKCLNLETLEKRRDSLCLKFAKGCLKNEKVKDMFPVKIYQHKMKKRKNEKYLVKKMNTERYKRSAIPFMVTLLNRK